MRFDSYHPGISFLYFAAVITCTAAFRHPIYLALSFLCAAAYLIKLRGSRGAVFAAILLPLALLFAAWYGSYHHFGVTCLRQNLIGNRMTLEALACGAAIGMTAAAILLWLGCVHTIFTADKVVYLFGRISPRLSLFLSILLRAVPRVKEQAHRIQTAQAALGRGIRQGNLLCRIRSCLRIGSILITWTAESFVTTADSMRCRGYTLPHRTAFSIYRFDHRDRVLVIVLCAGLTLSGTAALLGQTAVRFDPRIVMVPPTPLSFLFYAAYAALCLLPMALQIIGEIRFDRRQTP